ncbi:MAG: S-methyl-5-thioribose-1-phosphate isomerase [Dehalococcoidales bacterium]|nr:S-methyl-5-thioribose-1-phosphate isomerase [Dehalococcoidales bacterium]
MNKNKYTLNYQPIEWRDHKVRFLDQTLLPHEETYIETADYMEIATAIKELKVRGAPLIGVAGAYGMALGARQIYARSRAEMLRKLHDIASILKITRPTARNLFWAIERMEKVAKAGKSIEGIIIDLENEAVTIHREEAEATYRLSEYGAGLLPNSATILTHCNTGPLAATGLGTALGVIIYAHRQGKSIKVYADETRPLLQGARLTTWELQKAGIPVTLITDSMAGHFLHQGNIDYVIVGADRIALNGDTANKIGTYSLAVLAKENNVPFYVAAPSSTFDANIKSGEEIIVEIRNAHEVTEIGGVSIVPYGITAVSPAFDVTPAKYITAFITEKGIIKPPFGDLTA